MRYLASAILVTLISVQGARSQEVRLTSGCMEAYRSITALKFNDANRILASEKELYPDNLYILYLENYMDFLTIFIGEDEQQFEWLEENKSLRTERIEKLDDMDPFRNYMLGNIHLQWAVARLKFREYFTAAIEINKAYRLLEKNNESFPDFIPNKISLGVLHVMIGMVPDKYQWILDLISMEGSVEQGRAELEQVVALCDKHDAYRYLKDETLFYSGFIDLNIQRDSARIDRLMLALKENSGDNLLLSYLLANLLMRTGENDEAIRVLDSAARIRGTISFHYLDYLKAECRLRKMDPEAAESYYGLFLQNFRGRNYIGDAWRKMGWTALMKGDTSGYFGMMEKVIAYGHTDVDIDKEALREARSGDIPHLGLMGARLLFDGGYLHDADTQLHSIDPNELSAVQRIELEYRMARVFHEMGQTGKAKAHYRETIEMGSQQPRYFAGNSALKLGEIYESEGERERAVFYYRTCLNLEFEEYENSIHSKAKAGLERLEN